MIGILIILIIIYYFVWLEKNSKTDEADKTNEKINNTEIKFEQTKVIKTTIIPDVVSASDSSRQSTQKNDCTIYNKEVNKYNAIEKIVIGQDTSNEPIQENTSDDPIREEESLISKLFRPKE